MSSLMDTFKRNLSGADACMQCGLCMSYCAWDEYETTHPGQHGNPTICRDCMLCFRVCSRAHNKREELEVDLFGARRDNPMLGYYRSACGARAIPQGAYGEMENCPRAVV